MRSWHSGQLASGEASPDEETRDEMKENESEEVNTDILEEDPENEKELPSENIADELWEEEEGEGKLNSPGEFECVECDKKIPKRKRVRHQWMHEQIKERKKANQAEKEMDGNSKLDETSPSSSKMFECPNCLRSLKTNRNRHLMRCQKANLLNDASEAYESKENEVEKEREEFEDESESDKKEEVGGSRKQEKWECPGCKKSMQRANKNRHIRRCEVTPEEAEETIEDVKMDSHVVVVGSLWECLGCKKTMQRANKNRHIRRCQAALEAENSFEKTDETEKNSDEVKIESDTNHNKLWECSGCMKTMQKANRNRHIRRCEAAREANDSSAETNEQDEDVKNDFDDTDNINNEIKQLEMELEEESAKNEPLSSIQEDEDEEEEEEKEEEEELSMEAVAEGTNGRKYKDERVKCDVCEIDLMKSSMRRHMKRKHGNKDGEDYSGDFQEIGEE